MSDERHEAYWAEKAELLARIRELEADLSMHLPCDVSVPPRTVFKKGVSLSTLIGALKRRATQ